MAQALNSLLQYYTLVQVVHPLPPAGTPFPKMPACLHIEVNAGLNSMVNYTTLHTIDTRFKYHTCKNASRIQRSHLKIVRKNTTCKSKSDLIDLHQLRQNTLWWVQYINMYNITQMFHPKTITREKCVNRDNFASFICQHWLKGSNVVNPIRWY